MPIFIFQHFLWKHLNLSKEQLLGLRLLVMLLLQVGSNFVPTVHVYENALVC